MLIRFLHIMRSATPIPYPYIACRYGCTSVRLYGRTPDWGTACGTTRLAVRALKSVGPRVRRT
ncbi:hypothetical protein CEQ28_019145 [Hafnia alvei]|nr:hypothetical protein CEQ28_019145 [Hafnia alvei]